VVKKPLGIDRFFLELWLASDGDAWHKRSVGVAWEDGIFVTLLRDLQMLPPLLPPFIVIEA
jgi:hypothetical protein